ncbi:MAG: NUDIX domain-containing protein [Candidatus Aenigmatarchaeota archaeon]
METRIIVSAIIEKDGKFLFGKKQPGRGPYPNTWHLLGGGIERDETLIDAVKREILEESGLEITDIVPVSFDEDIESNKHGVDTHYIFLVFKTKYKSGKLTPKNDISELKWIDKSSLAKTKLNRPTVRLFRKLGLI